MNSFERARLEGFQYLPKRQSTKKKLKVRKVKKNTSPINPLHKLFLSLTTAFVLGANAGHISAKEKETFPLSIMPPDEPISNKKASPIKPEPKTRYLPPYPKEIFPGDKPISNLKSIYEVNKDSSKTASSTKPNQKKAASKKKTSSQKTDTKSKKKSTYKKRNTQQNKKTSSKPKKKNIKQIKTNPKSKTVTKKVNKLKKSPTLSIKPKKKTNSAISTTSSKSLINKKGTKIKKNQKIANETHLKSQKKVVGKIVVSKLPKQVLIYKTKDDNVFLIILVMQEDK